MLLRAPFHQIVHISDNPDAPLSDSQENNVNHHTGGTLHRVHNYIYLGPDKIELSDWTDFERLNNLNTDSLEKRILS